MFLIYTPSTAHAQIETTVQTIPETVQAFMDALSIPGVTVAIVDANTGFTWAGGFGYADTAAQIPVDQNTVFNLASVSKPMTAVAVLQLVDSGVLDLDTPLVYYIPQFSMFPSPLHDGNYANITPRMLLTHTSGVFTDFFGYGAITTGYENYQGYMNNLLEILAGYPMVFAEGVQAQYANHGFNLLGILVAQLNGGTGFFARMISPADINFFESFVSYTTENVFGPLGMENTSFTLESHMVPNLARPYENATTPGDVMMMYNGVPTGGAFSTAYDMARFMHFLLGNGTANGTQILSPASLDLMYAIDDSNQFMNLQFGHGLYRSFGVDGTIHYGHGGNLVHYHSYMMLDRDSGIGVFVSTNSTTGMVGASLIAQTIISTALAEGGMSLGSAPSIADPDAVPISLTRAELERYEGIYFAPGQYFWLLATDEGEMQLFVSTYLLDEPMIQPFVPMSDGSFTDPTGTRFWPQEINGTMWFSVGDAGMVRFLQRVDLSTVLSDEEVEPSLGSFVPEMPAGHISLIYNITIAFDRVGVPIMYSSAIHGITTMAPLLAAEAELLGFDSGEEFDDEGRLTAFYFVGIRFVREAP